MERFTEHVVRVRVADADIYPTEVWILECEGGLILVDVGFTPECERNIAEALRGMEKQWSDIKLILITHAHGDHIDNLKKTLDLTGGADVMLCEGDAPSLRKQTGVEATMSLSDGDVIGACGGIQVVSAPGHSRGNACYLLKGEKTMILGDTVMEVDGALAPPPAKYCDDPKKAEASIRKLLKHDFDNMLLSHGPAVKGGAKEKIGELVERLKR